jgi:hypothetical protein
MHLDREMSRSVVQLLKKEAPRLMRWIVWILPLLFCGCFDTPSTIKQSPPKEVGISSVSRFFRFRQSDSSSDAVEVAKTSTPAAYSSGMEDVADFEDNVLADYIARPADPGTGQQGAERAFETARASRKSSSLAGREQIPGFRNAVSLVFNTPFSLIFSRVFKQTNGEEPAPSAGANDEDLPNPFTEARLKQEPAAEQDSNIKAAVVAEDKTAEKDSDPEERSKTSSASPITQALPTPVSANESFLIVGDLDGSGALGAMTALRSSDTRFISEDGELDFSLYINPEAVARESSFYIDDIDMDGNADILVTRADWLLGGILLGDGTGGYRVAGTFVTGYEPSIPCAGSVFNGMREILAVSTRTGRIRTFQYTDKYRMAQTEKLGLVPDYLLHLVAPDTKLEFLMAAQTGGTEQILAWKNNGLLEPTADRLGADPTVLSDDFGSGSLVAYQVGNYASIVITSQGKSFNVANMKLLPGTFLVIGDLRRQGKLDVAVAGLEFFTPSQGSR